MSSTGKHLAFRLCFNGNSFFGTQLQPHRPSIQGRFEDVLQQVTGKKIRLHFLSRTDTGVHAYDSLFYWPKAFDLFDEKSLYRFFGSLNALLAPDIQVAEMGSLSPIFSPKNDVLWKEYRYFVLNSRVRDPFLDDRAWWVSAALDLENLKKVVREFEGVHDFAGFAKSSAKSRLASGRSSVREVFKAELRIRKHQQMKKSQILEFRFRADGFLQHMVRSMVGTLIDQARTGDFKISETLKHRRRELAGRTAPAQGLFLFETRLSPRLYAPLFPQKK